MFLKFKFTHIVANTGVFRALSNIFNPFLPDVPSWFPWAEGTKGNIGKKRVNWNPAVFPSTLSYHHFCVPNWVCKKPKAFSLAEDMNKSAGGLQSAVSPLVGPGQSHGGGPRDEAVGSSAYLGFENPLL